MGWAVYLAGKFGAVFTESCRTAGSVFILLGDTLRSMVQYRIRWDQLWEQMYFIGIRSQVVVLTTGAFTGAVFAAQVWFQFKRFGMESAIGPTVSIAMCRELGPVLCCLLLAGRVGAAMAAELSSMKITEQVDALRALGVYPTEYLIVPRFLALVISAPILTGLALVTGIGCGYFVAVKIFGVDGAYYWDNTIKFTDSKDVVIALIKSFIFAVIIAAIACHKGMNCPPGTAGVGKTTTEAVVNASLALLIVNFFLTVLLNALLYSN
ncbi:Ttg2B ABC-type transport system involved in resistance to organic solvents, permease component [Candidatus Methylacidiphilaceae bacterium]|jgi:phospholipid/cholesterol/gamma-HCH transport system permease protein|nr:ABC transporter permease [Candidatus Paceibacterota bacterium]